MKILLATGIYPPDAGGPAQYTRAMARALLREGHSVRVLTYGERDEEIHEDGFFVTKISRRRNTFARYFNYFLAAKRLAAGVDVVALQGPVSEGLPGTLGAMFAGKPVVMKVVGDYAWEMHCQSSAKAELLDEFLTRRHGGKIRIYEWIERWTARRAARIIAPSEYLAGVVQQWGVAPEKIQVIPNAVEAFPAVVLRSTLRRELGIDSKRVLFTAVRCVPWKHVDFLIQLLPELPDDIVFVVAGDGPERARWEKLAAECGMASRVRFLGLINREKMASWMTAADLFVLPSGYEGFPHVIPEAVSMGLPCLVSDKGGNPETAKLFGTERVQVLPYLDKDAWKKTIAGFESRRVSHDLPPALQFNAMLERTMRTYKRGRRVVMLSYERGFLEADSDASARLAALAGSDFNVSAIVLGNAFEKTNRVEANIKVIALRGNAFIRYWKSLTATIREVKEAKRNGEQIHISAQDPFVAGSIALIASRITNVSYEIQEHADYYSGYWESELPVIHEVMAWIGRRVFRRADTVRAVSERVRDRLINRVGVSPERIQVISVSQEKEIAVLQNRIPRAWPDVPTIVVPCRFVKQKGLNVLIRSLKILKDQGIAFSARLVGAGPLRNSIIQEANQFGLDDRITIEQWADVRELWNDADLFVLPSRYEGWGRTIVEAMAARVPIVTTDVGCVGSFMRPQVDGRVVAPNDSAVLANAIREQLNEKDRREWMVKNAFERSAQFPTQEALIADQRNAWERAMDRIPSVSRRAWISTLCVIGFVALVRFASVAMFASSLGATREWGFFTLVQNWFHGFGYSFVSEVGCASAYRSPGYLFFLTGVYGLFGFANFFAQAVIQNIIAILASYMVYRLGWALTKDRRIGLLAALLTAIHPYTFYHYTQYYHTPISSLFLVTLLWTLTRLDQTKKFSWAIWSGVFIAGLAYIQGTILPATVLISLWLAWRWRKEFKRAVAAIAIMAAVSIALIAPWTIRNWFVFHEFIPLTTDLGHALAKANNENIVGLTALGFPQEALSEEYSSDGRGVRYKLYPEAQSALEREHQIHYSYLLDRVHPVEPGKVKLHCSEVFISEPEFNRYWTGLASTWIKENYWTEGVKAQIQKIATFWSPKLQPVLRYGSTTSFWNQGGLLPLVANWSLTTYVLLLEILALIGFVIAARRKHIGAYVPIMIILGVYTFMHSFFAGYTKYRIPLDNLLAILAAVAIVAAWRGAWNRRKK